MLHTLADSAAVASDWWRLALPRPSRRPPRGRHLALLAWALPPSTNGGVYRPLSFLQYGPDAGWRIDAFQGPVPSHQRENGDELLDRIPPAVRRHVVPVTGREPAWRAFPHVDGGFVNAIDIATHCVAALRNDPPDVVLASGPPFCTFVAALWVAKRFGARLVLDYRDEWTECPFDFVHPGPHDRRWERRCLSAADAVLFTTESHRRHQLTAFPELSPDRAHLVPNGWEPGDFDDPGPTEPPDDPGLVTLAHVGNLAGHTPVEGFLAAAAELFADSPRWRERLSIQLVGRRSPAVNSALAGFPFRDRVQAIDHVGKVEATRRMRSADVLLLIAAPELERYLPGKLFDYLAARRPILVHGHRGEAAELVERLHAGRLCAPGTGGRGLGEALEQLSAPGWREDAARDRAVASWLQSHRRDTLARQAFQILGALSDRPRRAHGAG